MKRPTALASEKIASECLAQVAPAMLAFTSRWRLSTLQRVDPELHQLLMEQQTLYHAALVTGTDAEAREQTAAMIRGWRAACERLEAPLQPDDAYLVGVDARTGTHVVIGLHEASRARVQAHPRYKGLNAIFMTPDEVAAVVAGMRALTAVKCAFPDAEMIEIYPQGDEA